MKPHTKSIVQSVLCLLTLILAPILSLITAGPAQAQLLPRLGFDTHGAAYLRGELIIKFKAGATEAEVAEGFRQGQLELIRHVHTPAMKDWGEPALTHARTSLDVETAVRLLNALPGVVYAEPNFVTMTQFEADDPLYLDGSLWGMYSDDILGPIGPVTTTNPFGSQAEKVWAAGITGSRNVFVGIVDQGIQFDHPDLAANIWTNPGEIPDNGIDDDGDGYIDDVHGWNALDDNGTIYDPGYDDHGTHVTGTVGAIGGNSLGVAGVNWNVTLISGKHSNRNGSGTYLDAIQAIDYMVTLKTRKGLNIVALNNSYGGTSFSQAFLDAVTRAAQANIAFVAAAMNSTNNNDISPFYPACFDTTAGAGYDAVISVAAIDKDGNKASFSDYGATTVDLGAPGVGVTSTLPGSTYGVKSGTSMATPHVTGSLALYASTHPAASAQQLKSDLLTYGVVPTPSLQGITVTGGRLDVSALMSVPADELPAPAAPAILQAALNSTGRVDLSWSDQSDNELGFAIERSNDGQNFTLVDTVGANIISYTDRTVRPGTTCYYRIHAYNPGGSSGYVYAQSPVQTPYVTLPAAPATLTASAAPKGGVNLAWGDKSNNEEGFQIQRKTSTAANWSLLASVSPNTVKYQDTTTVSRTKYVYQVRAFNAAGVSAYSNEASATAK